MSKIPQNKAFNGIIKKVVTDRLTLLIREDKSMPKGANQKLKLYHLSRIMLEKTDDEHMITMPEIQKALEAYGVTADRKSLYDDLEQLRYR